MSASRLLEVKDVRIEEMIARGSFGVVHHGIKVNSDGSLFNIAVKVIRLKQHGYMENLVRKEIAVMRSMSHDYILKLYTETWNEDASTVTLYLEYCAAGTLQEYIYKTSKVPWPPEVKNMDVLFMAQIILGMEYLHTHGVYHRDLKPDNILLYCTDWIKIADFGFSVYSVEGLSGTVCGSPLFMAPEVAILSGEPTLTPTSGRTTTAKYSLEKADLWSLGAVLYYLLVKDWVITSSSFPRLQALYRNPAFKGISSHTFAKLKNAPACQSATNPSEEQLLLDEYDLMHDVVFTPEQPVGEFIGTSDERNIHVRWQLDEVQEMLECMLELDPSKRQWSRIMDVFNFTHAAGTSSSMTDSMSSASSTTSARRRRRRHSSTGAASEEANSAGTPELSSLSFSSSYQERVQLTLHGSRGLSSVLAIQQQQQHPVCTTSSPTHVVMRSQESTLQRMSRKMASLFLS